MIWAGLGWCATGIYLAAHAYLSMSRAYRRTVYLQLNVLGGVLLMVASIGMDSPHAVVINGYWAAVSLLALGGVFARLMLTIPLWALRVSLLAVLAVTTAVAVTKLHDVNALAAVVGWGGTVTYCAIYWLIATRQIRRATYLWLSMAAGLCVLPAYASDANWPSFALNICWIAISGSGLAKRTQDLPEESFPKNMGPSHADQ